MSYQRPPGPPPQDGRKVGIVEGWELRRIEQKSANAGAWKGLFFVIGLLAILVVGGWLAARPVLGPALTGAFIDNPSIVRIPIFADILGAEFADRVEAPAGTSDEKVKFVVAQGDPPELIRDNLVAAGLVTDVEAFWYELTRESKDQLLQAGQFTMTPRYSPSAVVAQLAGDPDPPTPQTTLALRAGWRIEQIVAYLQQQKEALSLDLDVKTFKDLALDPPTKILTDYDMLKQVPTGNSLEGFLAGGIYAVDIDITAEEVLRKLLDNWEDTNGDLVAKARSRKVDFYEALTIASLVERETPLDRERELVAGVYWNRIDRKINKQTGLLMQADPTVVYAADTRELGSIPLRQWDEYLFWDTLGVDLNTVDVPNSLSSFQTYRNKGLPDWPITTPSHKSLAAAISPNQKRRFLFFVSCEGENSHTFAKTVGKHNNNVRKCGLPV